MKKLLVLLVATIAMMVASVGQAEIFSPGNSSVQYSVNVDEGFVVSPTVLDYYGSSGYANAGYFSGSNPLFSLAAGAYSPAYSDAGIVLYFNGSLKLGQ